MTRYRLPEALGGGEYDGVRMTDLSDGTYSVQVKVPGVVGVVLLAEEAVTKVEPPPPPEPPLGSVVQIVDRFYHRRSDTGINWHLIGSDNAWETWQRLCRGRIKPTIYLAEPEVLPDWERELLEGGKP